MKRYQQYLSVLILAILVGVYSVHTRRENDIGCSADVLVARAMKADTTTARVAHTQSTAYRNGETQKAHFTVLHRSGADKTKCTDGPASGAWWLTRGDSSYIYLPNRHRLMVSRLKHLLTDNERTELLLRNYRARYLGTGWIGGRSAYIVRLSSPQRQRPSRELWIDRASCVILRSIDYSYSGEKRSDVVIEQMDCASTVDQKEFQLPSAKSVEYATCCRPATLAELTRIMGFTVGMPHYLPQGYEFEGCHLYDLDCDRGERAALLTYTDGLSTISIFQSHDPHGDASARSGCFRTSTCCVAETGQIRRGGRKVVVIADLPSSEVRRITESVAP